MFLFLQFSNCFVDWCFEFTSKHVYVHLVPKLQGSYILEPVQSAIMFVFRLG